MKQDRHIALLVDNCSAHPKDCGSDLTNVLLYFLPPNVTSIIQPCDMGIIRNLKALYRKSMISRIVSHLEITVTQLTRQVNILDAMHMHAQGCVEWCETRISYELLWVCYTNHFR